MNKNGRLFITKSVTVELLAKYRFWIKLGSIAPDLLFHTYLRGHTWDTTFDRNSIHMERLWEHGHMNRWSCFKLGYLLPYGTKLSPLAAEFTEILKDVIQESIRYTASLNSDM